MTLELAILAPVILALGALVLFAARVESAHQLVSQAAQDAARAASQARTAPAAKAVAGAVAQQDLAGHLTCQPMQLSVGGNFAPGDSVTTTVSCTTGLGVLPGHVTETATAASTIDVYRGVG